MKDKKQISNTNKPYLTNINKPYSDEDFEDAKNQGLDLDNWCDYERYYSLDEEPDYS